MATTTSKERETGKTANQPFEGTRRKVRAHLTQNEALIFEKSSPGKKAYKLPPLDVPEVDAEACWATPPARTWG